MGTRDKLGVQRGTAVWPQPLFLVNVRIQGNMLKQDIGTAQYCCLPTIGTNTSLLPPPQPPERSQQNKKCGIDLLGVSSASVGPRRASAACCKGPHRSITFAAAQYQNANRGSWHISVINKTERTALQLENTCFTNPWQRQVFSTFMPLPNRCKGPPSIPSVGRRGLFSLSNMTDARSRPFASV
jgi:hypothetical protein